jgi:hypothetical protein
VSATRELAAIFRRDLTRLLQELQAFPSDDALWTKRPGIANSAGHLFLHLEGNQREYIGRQLGGIDYTRDRDLEFNSPPISGAALMPRIEALTDLIPPIIAALTEERFAAAYPELMWGAPVSTRQFLVQLSGHLNYHLGQIDYLRRVLTGDSAIRFAQL